VEAPKDPQSDAGPLPEGLKLSAEDRKCSWENFKMRTDDSAAPAADESEAPARRSNSKVKAPAKAKVKAAPKADPKPAKKATSKAAKPAKAAPVKAAPAKAKAKAPAKESKVERDAFGYRKGSLKSQAAALYSRKTGATLEEVKEKLGSVQLNVLTELEAKGRKVTKQKVERKGQRAVTRYILT